MSDKPIPAWPPTGEIPVPQPLRTGAGSAPTRQGDEGGTEAREVAREVAGPGVAGGGKSQAAGSAAHPFEARSRGVVFLVIVALAVIMGLAASGQAAAAVLVLAVQMMILAVARLRWRKTWMRARGVVFDVLTLTLTALALLYLSAWI